MIASAAIPGTFPPMMIDVLAGGKRYQEMHVDGATAAQVFVYPTAMRLHRIAPRMRKLYIIRNARLDPEWAQVERRTVPIAFRAIACLVQFRASEISSRPTRSKETASSSTWPSSLRRSITHKQLFDTKYMQELSPWVSGWPSRGPTGGGSIRRSS
jgi:predicted acylesterase/phospholipase RssA